MPTHAGIPAPHLRDGSEDENIRALAPELIVVVAYGCILPKSVLEAPKYGCINLHVSLLPKYRGSAPVQWAVLNGDAETGVSIMQMDEGLDTGDVLCCEKIAIDPEETSGQLFDRVTAVGARVLCEVVPAIAAGTLKPQPQDHENACLAPMLNKEMAEFRLTESAAHIHNWVRGMNRGPVHGSSPPAAKSSRWCPAVWLSLMAKPLARCLLQSL
mgnify:CR=1 FL=1